MSRTTVRGSLISFLHGRVASRLERTEGTASAVMTVHNGTEYLAASTAMSTSQRRLPIPPPRGRGAYPQERHGRERVSDYTGRAVCRRRGKARCRRHPQLGGRQRDLGAVMSALDLGGHPGPRPQIRRPRDLLASGSIPVSAGDHNHFQVELPRNRPGRRSRPQPNTSFTWNPAPLGTSFHFRLLGSTDSRPYQA